MDNRPIGVFDSGVGGLTTVKELHAILPHEDILYFGDTGRVPYGTRSSATIQKYAKQDIRFLLSRDVKAVVAACGTVSANVLPADVLEMGITAPYTGIVEPATRAAYELTKNGRVGVIGTSAAIGSGAYQRAMRAINGDITVIGAACPLFVPLVENGMTNIDNQITRLTAEMYLEPLRREKIDTLILGCTHFPLLYDIIEDILNGTVRLVDAGASAARHTKTLLAAQNLLADRTADGHTTYHVTDTVDNFVLVADHFLNEDIADSTQFVDLDLLPGEL